MGMAVGFFGGLCLNIIRSAAKVLQFDECRENRVFLMWGILLFSCEG